MKKMKKIASYLILLAIVFTSFTFNNNLIAAAAISSNTSSTTITFGDMPEAYQTSIEWVYNNRMVKEGTPSYKNLIFDQIFAGDGTLNYVVRWQSSKSVTLEQRQKIAAMLQRQINNWAKCLKGYEDWPYDEITVNVVGWACADASQILDKQSNEIVYTDYITDELSKQDSSIPAKLPTAPSELSRADHYWDSSYSYPGGYDKRFDMYLWGTSNLNGGTGGDWGQRVSDDYILSMLDADEVHIIEHEMGHGFGFCDFYNDNERPPEGFPTHTIMWAGDSAVITDWDAWMLRYTWSQLKSDTNRFHISSSTDDNTLVNIASKATVSTSYVSSWESIGALNDGYDPVSSDDRNHLVYGNWPETGEQWVQYDFNQNYTIEQSDVYWFKDNQGIDVPNSYIIQYLDGNNWVDVTNSVGLGTAINQYNTTTFTPVSTKGVRIVFTSDTLSTGILEWKIMAHQ